MRQKLRPSGILFRHQLLGLLGVALIVVTTLSLMYLGGHAVAAGTTTINFQARLMNAAGSIAADGDYNVEFKLYNASSSSGSSQGSCSGDANCLWTETRTSGNKVHVANGYLTVSLGSVTSFSSSINWSQQLWLTMNIGGTGSPSWDGEMSPRLQLTAVPYAFAANTLATASGSNTSSLVFATPAAAGQVITLPNPSSGTTATVCYQNDSGCGFAVGSSGSFIQNGTTVQTNANFNIRSAAIGSVGAVIQGANGQTADLLQLQSYNGTTSTNVFRVNNNGVVTLAGGQTADITTGSANLTIAPGGTNTTLTLNSNGTGNLNVGTNAADKTINIGAVGSTVGSTTIHIADTSDTSTTQSITIGSISAAANTTVVQGGNGSGAVSVQAASSGTINLGTTNNNQLTLGGSSSVVKLGNLGASTVNAIAVCRDSSTAALIACGSGTGNGTPFLQGGNAFGATAVLGTTDAFNLQIITGSSTGVRATFDQSNNLYLGNGVTANAPNNFTVAGTGSSAAGTNGAILTIQGGAGASSSTGSAGGDLSLKGGAAGGTGDNNGGAITIQGGTATGAGTRGNVFLQASGGMVAIGTSSPDTSAKLEVSGSISTPLAAAYRAYQNVVGYSNNSAGVTGTMKITMPLSWNNTMMRMTIKGYNFTNNTGAWEVVIGGYNYLGTPAWIDTSVEFRGRAPFSSVRLGYDGTKNVVLLGTTSTVWDFPKITVSEFTSGYNGWSGAWGSGWSMAPITTETGITNIVTPSVLMYMNTSGFLGIGNANPAALLSVGSSSQFQVDGTGAVTAVGVNSGSGLIQGSGGLTLSGGALTVTGGLAADITTASAGAAAAMTLQPGLSTGSNGTGGALTLKAGDENSTTCGTACTGGTLTLQGGSATGASGTTRNGGSVSIDAGTGATANGSITIGGTNATGVTVGKAAGTVTLQGTLKIGTALTTSTNAAVALCRDTSTTNIISCATSTGNGTPFVQGGNAFGAPAVLGTTDAQNLQIITGASGPNVRATFDTSNNLYLGNGVTAGTPNDFGVLGTGSTTAGTAGGSLKIQGGAGASATTGSVGGGVTLRGGDAGGSGNNAGGNVTLTGGAATGTGAKGAVVVKNAADSATAFQVQNAAGTTTVFNVDSTNSRVGIGTIAPTQKLHIVDTNGSAPVTLKVQNLAGTTNTETRLMLSTTATTTNETTGAAVTAHRTGGSGNGSTDLYLQTSDSSSVLNTWVTVASTGTTTFAGQLIMSNVASDITTGTNEDLVLVANGTGIVNLNDTVKVGTLGGATATSAAVCRDTSTNTLTACDSSNTSGVAFLQGGNNFGATGVLGTKDAFDLQIITGSSSTVRATFDQSNGLYLGNGVTANAPNDFTVSGAGSSTAGTAGATLTIKGGAGASTGTGSIGGDLKLQGGAAGGSGNNNGGNVLLQGGLPANSGTTGGVIVRNPGDIVNAFQVQNAAASSTIMNVDTLNGRVGIGGTATVSKLEVLNGDAAIYNSGLNPKLILGDSTTAGQNGYLQWDSNNDYFRIETVGTNGLKVKDNYVSIGNIFPSQPLIVGNATTNLFQIDTAGVATLIGGQTADITTAVTTGVATALALQPGTTSTANGTGAALSLKAGDESSTTCGAACTGGAITIQGGSATGGSGTTRNGGAVNIDGGAGATAAGAINIGAANSTSITIGSTGSTNKATTVSIATTSGASTQAVSIGSNGATANTIDIDAGTGVSGIEIGNTTTAHGIQIGSNASADNDILFGSANSGSTVNIEGGTATNAIQIGNGATAHGIQIGTGAAVQTVAVGSTNGASATTIQAGTGNLRLQTSAAAASIIAQSATNGTAAFQIQNAALSSLFNVDTTDSNLIVNPGAETAFSTDWTGYQTGGSVSRTTTAGQFYSGVAGVSVTTGTTNTAGGKNSIGVALTNGTQYVLSFWAKLSSGTMTDLQVGISKDGTTGTEQQCGSNLTLSTSAWTHYSCTVTPSASGNTSAYVFFRQANTGTSRTFFVDNVGLTASTNTTTPSIKIGGQGATTILTLDQAAGSPITTGQSAYLGSIYYNTTTGHVQCYEDNGVGGSWGDCGNTTLQQGYTNSTGGTTPEIILDSTRNGIDIQDKTGGTIGATQGLFNVRGVGTASTLGASLFTVNGSGQVGINNGSTSATPSINYDLSLGQIAGATTARTIGVEAQGTSATGGNGLSLTAGTGNTTGAGGQLTLQGGTSGNGAGATGGAVLIQGGTANGSGTSNGGNVTIQGGTLAGSGTKGLIQLNGGTYFTAGTFSSGSSGTITQSLIDSNTSINAAATAGGLTFTVPSPTITSNSGRLLYITNNGANAFTLSFGSTSFTLNVGSTATLLWQWNGSSGSWTSAGVDASTLQNVYNNSSGSTTPEIILDSTRNAVDIQDANGGLGSSVPLFAVRAGAASGLGTALLTVTNNNGNTGNALVGINTNVATRTLDISVNNSTISAPPLLVQQAGSGDTGMELKLSSKSYFIGLDNSDAGKFKISSTTANINGTSIIGYNNSGTLSGATLDNGSGNVIVCQQFTSSVSGTAISMTAAFGAPLDSTNNKYRMALYTNNAGNPGTLIAQTAEGTISAGWNTIGITATITSSTVYWLCVQSNTSISTNNNMYYLTPGSNAGKFQSNSGYPSWPSGGWSTGGVVNWLIYARVNTGGATDTYSNAIMTLSDTGQATFQNAIDSTTAFQVQNAAGNTLFGIDTNTPIVNVGTTGTTALATTLNLNTSTGATQTINVGSASSGSAANGTTVLIQGGNTSSAVSIQSLASGTIGVGTNNAANTLQFGSTTLNSGTQAINIGTNSTSGGTTNIIIGTTGSATGATTVRATGAVTITAGAASTWSTTAGNLTIQASSAGGSGALNLTGGAATGAATAGNVVIQGGAASATAGSNGGGVTITGAVGSTTGTGGTGGSLTLTAGSAGGSGNNNGGSIAMVLGAATGTGTQGSFQVQNALGASLLTVDPSNTAASLNLAVNSGGETASGFTTTYPAAGFGSNTAVSQTTTAGEFASGAAAIKAVINPAAATAGIRANLGAALSTSTVYAISFSAKTTGSNWTGDIDVRYNRTGTTSDGSTAVCSTSNSGASSFSTRNITTSGWTKINCYITTSSTAGDSTANIVIFQTASATRTFYIDNISVVQQNSSGTQNVGALKVGGATSQGLTLFTLDAYATQPFTGSNSALAGSMYFDTTAGKIQCYDGSTWGACGAAPNSIITLSPEFAGAVLHGTAGTGGGSDNNIGTLTSDFCSDFLDINDATHGTSICGTNETFNFYRWTSPQSNAQTYDIYITYQLPSTFKNFISGQTNMLGRTDSANSTVSYTLYKNVSGTGLSLCSAAKTVSTGSQSSWQTATPTTDPSTCSFAANNSLVVKVEVTSSNNANAYVGTLNFQYSNQ